jgi:hypothetical protein
MNVLVVGNYQHNARAGFSAPPASSFASRYTAQYGIESTDHLRLFARITIIERDHTMKLGAYIFPTAYLHFSNRIQYRHRRTGQGT